MGHDEVTHMGFMGRGAGPRHCSQSAWSEPVERYYGRAAVICHL
jgi:hypothetical protein